MDDVYAWADDQREKNRREFFSFLDEQRGIWTPRHIFNRCCVKWLADGDLDADDGFGYFDEYSCRNGCDGSRCGRDHPSITLRFDISNGATVATMSHLLDPFVQYFSGRVSEGTAWPQSRTEYQLDGYLRGNWTHLRSHDGFGTHLVKVAKRSLRASDSAQKEEQEAKERAAKRQRVSGSTVPSDLFEKAIDIVLKERLQKDLENDYMSLFCLRSTSTYLKTVAEAIAARKIPTLSVSLTLLEDGREQFGEGTEKLDGYDSETWDVGCWDPCDPQDVVQYNKTGKIDFVFRETGEGSVNGAFYPVDTAASTFSWDSGKLRCDVDEDEDRELWRGFTDDAEYSYRGQLMHAYWHPNQVDPVAAPSRFSMYGQARPKLGILMGKFYIEENPKQELTTKTTANGVTLNYEVTNSTAEEETKKDIGRRIQYHGEIRISNMKIDFGFLVQQHAKKIASDLKAKYRKIQRERPLTTSELDYGKMVELASN